MKTKLIRIKETDSTNHYLHDIADRSTDDITTIVADFQTNGHGQGSNSWESEAGKNLLFSVLVHPTRIPVGHQFLLSEAMALALREALLEYAPAISIKWPNDIYCGDRKLSGTLIETSVSAGRLKHVILGVGVNVNQTIFRSNAPNPISLCQVTGKEINRKRLLKHILKAFEAHYGLLLAGGTADTAAQYYEALWRHDGYYRYRDTNGEFEGSIFEVEDDGHLLLHDREGHIRRYGFKEIEFII